jgi:cytochrome c oxidase assembly protein Cox11
MSRRHPRPLLVSVAVITTALFGGSIGTCLAQTAAAEPRRFDLRIENGRIADNVKTVQVQRDEVVEFNWSSDRRTDVHLHGYDIEVTVNPGQTQVMTFRARATGRFPIEAHGVRHTVLLYLEVHPR